MGNPSSCSIPQRIAFLQSRSYADQEGSVENHRFTVHLHPYSRPCSHAGQPISGRGRAHLSAVTWPADKPVEVLRFANRVPLMYQQGGCLLTKAIESVDWRQYGLDQPGAKGVPKGPAAILVHLASTNVQFTSEAKEALADNGEVIEEARKAMLEMGRGLRKHLEKKKKMAKTKEKFELINDILPAIAKKSADILGKPVPDLAGSITKIMSAVISETETVWNKETKQTDVSITLFNYTSRDKGVHNSGHLAREEWCGYGRQ